MSFNGAGVYTPPGASFPAVTATTISSTKYNAVIEDIATALTNCVTRDGQSPATADIPMGGFKHTNVADAAASTDGANIRSALYKTEMPTSTGSANAQLVAYTYLPSALTNGAAFKFIAGYTNTNDAGSGIPATFKVGSFAAKSLYEGNLADFLASGSLIAGYPYVATYVLSIDGFIVEPILSAPNFVAVSGVTNDLPSGIYVVKDSLGRSYTIGMGASGGGFQSEAALISGTGTTLTWRYADYDGTTFHVYEVVWTSGSGTAGPTSKTVSGIYRLL